MSDIITPSMFKLGLIRNNFEFFVTERWLGVEPTIREWRTQLMRYKTEETTTVSLVITQTTVHLDPMRNKPTEDLIFELSKKKTPAENISSVEQRITTIHGLFGKPKRILATLDFTNQNTCFFNYDRKSGIKPSSGDYVHQVVEKRFLKNGSVANPDVATQVFYVFYPWGKE